MSTLGSRIFNNPAFRKSVEKIIFVIIIINQRLERAESAEWPWSEALTTEDRNITGKLAVIVLWRTDADYPYMLPKWEKLEKEWILKRIIGDEIKIGCQMINGTTHEKVTGILIESTSEGGHREGCVRPGKLDCWYDFMLTQTVVVSCFWANNGQELKIEGGLMINFKIHAVPPTTRGPLTTQTTQPRTKPEPKIYEIGPYMIRNVGQQQLLFNPEWSLKHVELIIQTNISEIQPACLSFLRTSFKGWTMWSQKQTHLRSRMKRDLTGVLRTGSGVLNGIDSEVLMNKLATATSDLTRLRQPLQSSLLALGTSQWQVSKVLPSWEKDEDQDHRLILDALSMVKDNVSLAFSCIQAQLWMQATAALIIREGNEGIFPVEIRKAVWDKATNFERRFQSWWTMVNFTYDPTTNMATAFVLTIRNATVYVIHPIIALGLNHEETVLYPSEHRAWARKVNEKWQTVNVESCITREQQGFICESNTIDAQDVCLDTEQSICHFEIHPDNSKKTVIVYTGQGCICLRTACVFVEIDHDNVTLPIGNHSNFCICNFAKIIGCDFVYWAPVVSHQLIKSKITGYLELSPTPIGMNLTLVRQLIKHQDLLGILREIQRNGEKTLVTVHHDTKEINRVLQRTKQDASHNWWDTLFGWSPSAAGILNTMIHPIVILLGSLGILLVLTIMLYLWVWRMFKRITAMHEALYYSGKLLK
ncbi:uncharacterized protein LOC122154684 [Tyto alba]|uniref:uncharacterized protein LOC122154684 n=1 Tax=Tyto alba TaxID=56313 RepID=UPI001C66EA4D|nr:uncharacterized protein LOC122154684 [Tyto alba]